MDGTSSSRVWYHCRARDQVKHYIRLNWSVAYGYQHRPTDPPPSPVPLRAACMLRYVMPDTLWQATAAAAKAAAAGQPPGSAGGLMDVTRGCMGAAGQGGRAWTRGQHKSALCCAAVSVPTASTQALVAPCVMLWEPHPADVVDALASGKLSADLLPGPLRTCWRPAGGAAKL